MQVTVNSDQALLTALSTVQSGDTILLSAGSYSRVGLQGVNFAGAGVTIASADPTSPVVVAGIELSNSSGLTFRDIEVTINPRTQTAFNVVGSSNIHLDGVNMHGAVGGDKPGLLIRNSTNVSVNDTQFHDLGTGLRTIDSSFVTISNNRFFDLAGDGFQSTGTSNITITRNHFTNFHTAPGDHPDAIQFFTLNQATPAQNITITDNVIVRGSGDIVQGIFLGNEIDLPYINVTITGNKVVGAMYNGIAVGMGQNVTLTNNIVQAYTDQGSWIIVEKSLNALVSSNRSTDFIDKENRNTNFKDNNRIRPAKVGDLSVLDPQPAKAR